MRAALKALMAAVALAVLLVGLPLTLLRFGSWPFHAVPSIDELRRIPEAVLTDDAVFSILTVAVWAAWGAFMVSVLVEVASQVAGRPHVRLPLASPLQAGARHLVAALLVTTTLTGQAAGSRSAAPPSPAVATTVPAPPARNPGPPPNGVTPPTTSASPAAPAPPSAGTSHPPIRPPATHPAGMAGPIVTVRPGDTPWSIAEQHLGDGMRWRELWDLNHQTAQADGSMWVDPKRIDVGWRLDLPPDATAVSGADHREPTTAPTGENTYIVQPGDTLSGIALAELGNAADTDALFAANAGRPQPDGRTLSDPNLIVPGWTIVLPGHDSAQNLGTPAEPAAGTETHSAPRPSPRPRPTPARHVYARPSTSAPPISSPRPPTTVTAPASSSAATTIGATPTRPRRPVRTQSHRQDVGEVIIGSAPDVVGVTGALVLATAVVDLVLRKRRRRTERSARNAGESSAPTSIERAVTAASDLPLVRWAGQMIAQMAESLDTSDLHALPVAVELSEEHGLEVLWSEPTTDAPSAWTEVEGGWSWSLPYDPEAPTPVDELPARLPALVTVGQRDGRQLLLNVEAFGVVGVSGPPDRVTNLLRAVAAEHALSGDIADAYPLVVGSSLSAPAADRGRRREAPSVADAQATLESKRRSIETAVRGGHGGAFAYRSGSDAPHSEATIAVVADASDGEIDGLLDVVIPDRTIGAVVHDPSARCPNRIDLTADSAVFHPLGIEFEPVQLPAESAADLTRLLRGRLTLEETPEDDADAARDDPVAPGSPTAPVDRIDLRAGPPSESPTRGGMPTREPAPEVLVRVLGQPRVDGRPGLGQRELSLTAFLAMHRRPVTGSDVIEALWGGKGVQARSLWNLASNTRGALGKLASGEAVLPFADQADKTYRLHPDVACDLDILRRAYQRSLADPCEEAAAELDRALDLVEGRPFGTAGFEWAFRDGQYGAMAQQLIEDAALRLATLARETGDIDLARRAVHRGLHGVPGNEVLYRERMQIEADAGNASGVQQAYKELVLHLLDFEERPSTETIELRKALRRRAPAQGAV
jgi:nucleoid-associated protein YgaU